MESGRTLWEELCRKCYSGTDYVDKTTGKWMSLAASIDPGIHAHVRAKLEKHKIDAAIWRDTCLEYFKQFSGKPIIERRE